MTLTIEIDQDLFFKINEEIRGETIVVKREDKNYNYSNDEKWQELKKVSNKAYKELKKREYFIKQENGDL